MSTYRRLKITLVGSPRVGKTSFIRELSDYQRNRFSTLRNLGISIEIIDTNLDNEEICRSAVWELSQRTHHQWFIPTFFRGAAGSIIFFDLSCHQTFEDLNLWIKLIRKINGNIPIYLIGSKEDLEPDVFPDEIDEFFRNNSIIGYSSTTVYDESKRDTIFKKLITNVVERYTNKTAVNNQMEPIQESLEDILNQINRVVYRRESIVDDYYNSLPAEEKIRCDNFIGHFTNCPICKNENHVSYLRKFYSSKNKIDIELKKQLMKVLKLSENFDKLFYNKIILGIPCCNCFQSFFPEEAP
ncbi:MAG: hypothetical protein ACW98D_06880 [Promethearchaeota archaeon]|jgi:GTPase SAR1 family protein